MSFGTHLFVEAIDVEDEDWAARSQAQLRAITIGRLVGRPVPGMNQGSDDAQGIRRLTPLLVVIQPSMGFGTGHHATTRLMLRALQELPFEDRTVLDIGCGSGVLAIAAVKLGARSAIGIDVDPDALENARENVELNGVTERRAVRTSGLPRHVGASGRRDGEPDRRRCSSAQPSSLAELVDPGGYLIVSGFMKSDESVTPALAQFLLC